MRIFFAGTPDFAIPALEVLNADQDIDVRGVFCQPSRPRGRGQKKKPAPVARAAQELGLMVHEVADINQEAQLAMLSRVQPAFLVVVAFGQKIGRDLLQLPDKGAVNLHASLLPRYRGPNPIQRAILNGDSVTGVSTMLMDEGWDTGPVFLQEKVEIRSNETLGSLHDRLAIRGAHLLPETLKKFFRGEIEPQKQPEGGVHAPKLSPEEMYLNWNYSAGFLERQVRALNPFPGARTVFGEEEWKIWKARVEKDIPGLKTGSIKTTSREILVQTSQGSLNLLQLQRPGKKTLAGDEFLRGFSLPPGSRMEVRGEKNG